MGSLNIWKGLLVITLFKRVIDECTDCCVDIAEAPREIFKVDIYQIISLPGLISIPIVRCTSQMSALFFLKKRNPPLQLSALVK